MKLLPYILTKRETKDFTFWKFTVFLSFAGKSIWEESGPLSKSVIQHDYCELNGLYAKDIVIDPKKQLALIQIDTQKTNLSEFYIYEEALQKPDKPECWRSFYFIQDKGQIFWWSPKGLIEAEIQGGGNIQELFEDCIRWSKDTAL
jgi:hypothetical protein